MKIYYPRSHSIIMLMMLDVASVLISFWAAYQIRLLPIFKNFQNMGPKSEYIWLAWVGIPVYLVLLHYQGLYRYPKSTEWSGVSIRIIKVSLLGGIILSSFIFIIQAKSYSRALLILFLTMHLLTTLIFRIVIIRIVRLIVNKKGSERNVLIVGTGAKAAEFIRMIQNNPDWQIQIRGVLAKEMDNSSDDLGQLGEAPVIGDLKQLKAIITEEVIDDIIFCLEKDELWHLDSVINECEQYGIPVHIVADFFNLLIAKVQVGYLGKLPILTFSTTPFHDFHLFLKRMLDIVISVFFLFLFALPMILISILIKLESDGPVFFAQERVGLNGRRFRLFKFRSMVQDAEKMKSAIMSLNEMDGPVFKSSKDPRITKIGYWIRKYSLDEIPQLWNILLGDMSLVGPRPAIPEEVNKYESWQRRRLSMKPGLTCIWQISGRNEIDFNEWMKMDLQYIDGWSLQLDMVILLKTIPAVLSTRGAR